MKKYRFFVLQFEKLMSKCYRFTFKMEFIKTLYYNSQKKCDAIQSRFNVFCRTLNTQEKLFNQYGIFSVLFPIPNCQLFFKINDSSEVRTTKTWNGGTSFESLPCETILRLHWHLLDFPLQWFPWNNVAEHGYEVVGPVLSLCRTKFF